MLNALFEYDFLRNALLAGLLASLLCGMIGSVVVEKRMVLLCGGIAHTSYGGVGLGFLLGFPPILGAFLFSITASLSVGWLNRKSGAKPEILIGLFWSFGMALGILFQSLAKGYPVDLATYLFGSILAVSTIDLILMLIVTIVAALLLVLFFPYWKAYLFDEEFARIRGIPTGFLETVLMVLVAVTIVVLIRVVGIILVLALLTAPSATASLLSSKLSIRMLFSSAFGTFYCITGLFFAYRFDVSAPATIVILSVLVYFFVHFLYSPRKC